jgi:hypothetical protein
LFRFGNSPQPGEGLRALLLRRRWHVPLRAGSLARRFLGLVHGFEPEFQAATRQYDHGRRGTKPISAGADLAYGFGKPNQALQGINE